MSRKAIFRGVSVEVLQARVKDRQNNRHYYEIRRPEDSWASNATLEREVRVNFWGTLVSDEALDFGGDDYTELSDREMKALLVEQELSGEESSAAS